MLFLLMVVVCPLLWHLYCNLKDNGYSGNFIKSVSQPNNAQSQPGEKSKAYALIPHVKRVSDRIRRILNGETDTKTAFKPLKYKVSCRTVPFAYIGERVKEVGSPGGLNTSLERMGMSARR